MSRRSRLSAAADWQGHDLKTRRRRPLSACGGRGTRPARSKRRCSAPTTYAERLGGDRGRIRRWTESRHDGDGAAPVQGHPAAAGVARHGRRCFCLRRFRPSSNRHRRNAGRRAVGPPGPKIWAIFERARRRLAAASFSRTSCARCRRRTASSLPAVFRSSLPDDQRLSAEQIVAGSTRSASMHDTFRRSTISFARWPRIAGLAISLSIMSNGGFDDFTRSCSTPSSGATRAEPVCPAFGSSRRATARCSSSCRRASIRDERTRPRPGARDPGTPRSAHSRSRRRLLFADRLFRSASGRRGVARVGNPSDGGRCRSAGRRGCHWLMCRSAMGGAGSGSARCSTSGWLLGRGGRRDPCGNALSRVLVGFVRASRMARVDPRLALHAGHRQGRKCLPAPLPLPRGRQASTLPRRLEDGI